MLNNKKLISLFILFTFLICNVFIPGNYAFKAYAEEITDNKTVADMVYSTSIDKSNENNIVTLALEKKVEKSPLRERVEAAIKGAAQLAPQNHHSMDWVAVGLARTGNKNLIPDNYLEEVEEYLDENNGEFPDSPTEYGRMTLGVLAAGGDPTNIGGYNLIEKIANADLEEQGINALIYGLVTLDAKDYETPEDARWNRSKLIKAILDDECSNKGTEYGKKAGWLWGSTEENDKADADMTGMAMTALAPYNNDKYPEVQEAIARAVDWLKYAQYEDGSFGSWGTKTSESCAQVIMGLCTNNIDPAGKEFTKNGKNVVDALLSFELKNHKGFAHMVNEDGILKLNGMANEQALYALAQYLYYVDGKGSIYHWTKEDKITEITVEGLEDGEVVKEQELSFTVKANEAVTVTLNGEELDLVDGEYIAKLNEGNNKIVITAKDQKSEYTVFYLIPQFEVEKIGEGSFKKGEEAHLKVKSTNISKANKEVSLIIALYDKANNKLVNYSYVNKTLKANETEELAGGFLIPEIGNYVVKGFVWDNMQDMNILSLPVEVEVK